MKLYIVRHGSAAGGTPDFERVLTPLGREECAVMGAHLARAIGPVDLEIFHSPRVRAVETASILASHICAAARSVDLLMAPDLNPDDDPDNWIEKCRHLETDTMLVSHLPLVKRLVSKLIDPGNDHNDGIAPGPFSTCSAACLSRNGDSPWLLEWFATPSSIGAQGAEAPSGI